MFVWDDRYDKSLIKNGSVYSRENLEVLFYSRVHKNLEGPIIPKDIVLHQEKFGVKENIKKKNFKVGHYNFTIAIFQSISMMMKLL